jgi:hypothetical protein
MMLQPSLVGRGKEKIANIFSGKYYTLEKLYWRVSQTLAKPFNKALMSQPPRPHSRHRNEFVAEIFQNELTCTRCV